MLLTVAVIGPAHALKGEVRLDIRTDDPEGRLAPGTSLPVQAPRGDAGPAGPVPDHLTVARLRFDGARWFARFEEARDRTAAEALRGARLMVDPDAADRGGAGGAGGADTTNGADRADSAGGADDDAWYAHELIGLRAVRVVSGALPDGEIQHLGEVVDLEPGVAQDRLVVRTPDGERVAVPFVAELVPEIDPDAGTITLAPPGGLFPGVGRTEEAR